MGQDLWVLEGHPAERLHLAAPVHQGELCLLGPQSQPHTYESLGFRAGPGQTVAVALAAPQGVPDTQTKRTLLTAVTLQTLNVRLAAALSGAVGTRTHVLVHVARLQVGARHRAAARRALWEVPVTQLALVALLPPEAGPAHAAARVGVALLGLRAHQVTATRLAASGHVMSPVIGGTLVTPLPDGVGRADTLACVGVTVVPYVGTLAGCAPPLLEVEVSGGAAVTLGPAHARLAATLPRIVTVEGLGAKRVTVTRNTASCGLETM